MSAHNESRIEAALAGAGSAELHSAVSPNCIRQTLDILQATEITRVPQIANLRYSRVQLCATEAF